MTVDVAAALAHARTLGVDRLDAQLLLARALGRSRSWLLAHGDATIDAAPWATLRGEFARRAAGEPLAYVLGEKEFHGLLLQVTPDVLVPRPDTETLVDWGLELLRTRLAERATPNVVDLGTGTGAVALAVKHGAPGAQVSAVDVSPAALAVAGSNARRCGLPVTLHAGDWWQPLAGQRFDLALSNPPYIAQADPHLPALSHEPRLALVSGADGLDALRRIVADAAGHLEPGGWLLVEHGHDQAPAVRTLFLNAGFVEVETRSDLSGIGRCTGGTPSASA